MKKLIAKVRPNKFTRRDGNHQIPYAPQEIVDDALACREAGAAIAHFHAREADGTEGRDLADFRSVISGIRARSMMLVHPTLVRAPSSHPCV